MLEIEDWLQDPLRKLDNNTYKTRILKTPKGEQQDKWFSFHFATRLKLDGAVFFCRQVLGAASMPYDLGLPLLAHRQIEWYLEAFFFELMSAYDTLLQELNIIYAYDLGLKPDQVRWSDKGPNEFIKMLPDSILKDSTEERKKDWFKKIQRYRNTATHHYTVPLSSGKTWVGTPINYSWFNISMQYLDEEDNYKLEDIKLCEEYLKRMVYYITSIWQHMAKEFK
ncbi:MAG: Cthe_2314 family HEPN domain-containing protein [Dehalococcoidales bacterium]